MLNKRGILNKRKKGLSAIVTAMILVVMTFVLVSIIWTVVNRIVNKNIEESESCFGIFDKITLNNEYTCFNSTSNETLFSINIKDINIEGLLVVITESGNSKSYTLTNNNQSIPGLRNYPDGSGDIVKLPVENAGRTYISTDFLKKPSSIEIAPIINENQCDSVDSSYEIGFC